MPLVVVVGGGFGGLEVVKRLEETPVRLTLIDRTNYHLFQPLLYQVATAELSPTDVATPLRKLLRGQDNVDIILARVQSIDLDRRMVQGPRAEVQYDYLVLAMGAVQTYFGRPEFEEFAPGLKTLDDAVEIRRRILLAFEEAEWEADDLSRRAKLTFVVVGGGPTGVELAGAVHDMATRTLPEDFRFVDTMATRTILVHGGDELLQQMPGALGRRARRDLEAMGVEVRLNSHVTDVDGHGVMIGDERIAAENVFWAAGVRGDKLARQLDAELDEHDRIIVGPDLSLPGHPEVFALGDAAHAIDRSTRLVPGVAPAALQEGAFVARTIHEECIATRPQQRRAFRYSSKGAMATIGRGKAVVSFGRFRFGGLLAWVAWGGVHLATMAGTQSKISVLGAWIGSYIFASRRSRLITGDPQLTMKDLRGDIQLRTDREPGDTDQAPGTATVAGDGRPADTHPTDETTLGH